MELAGPEQLLPVLAFFPLRIGLRIGLALGQHLDLFIEHRHQGRQADGQHAVAAAGDLIREGAFRGWEGLVERVNGFRGLLLAMRLRQEPLRDFARGRMRRKCFAAVLASPAACMDVR
jgi:hypothetical protein